MELINEAIENYALQHCSNYDEKLLQVYNNTNNQHQEKHMQSSWVQGKLLEFISCIKQPKYILEIGTFTGFSALCLVKGLATNGELHTIELRDNDADTAQQNFSISEKLNQIHLHRGNALEIIPTLKRKWDLVFIDADKTNYCNYYKLVLPQLQDDGLIIADNVLFHGQVLHDEPKNKSAKAIKDFNKMIAADNEVEQVLLTVRDGLMFIKKRK